jgi:formylglycine-generating enzyme required for sulfatase activity
MFANSEFCGGELFIDLDTQDVFSHPEGKSFFGIYNLLGNVAEWVNDWYDEEYYPISSARNPEGPDNGNYRVIRGGGWSTQISYIYATKRFFASPLSTNNYLGFRCAKGATP